MRKLTPIDRDIFKSSLLELLVQPGDIILNEVATPSGFRPTKIVKDLFIDCQVNQVAQSVEIWGRADQEPSRRRQRRSRSSATYPAQGRCSITSEKIIASNGSEKRGSSRLRSQRIVSTPCSRT